MTAAQKTYIMKNISGLWINNKRQNRILKALTDGYLELVILFLRNLKKPRKMQSINSSET